MTKQELLLYRASLFKNAITCKERNDRVPYFSQLYGWRLYDAGIPLEEGLTNYDLQEKAIIHCAENYPVDIIADTGWRNPLKLLYPFGNDQYKVNEELYGLEIHDQCFMDETEYDDLIADPKKWLWETYVPRKYRKFNEPGNIRYYGGFLQNFGEWGQFMGRVGMRLATEYGLPDYYDNSSPFGPIGSGFEMLFNFVRGIRGLSVDMRRIPDKVGDAVTALNDLFYTAKYTAEYEPGTCPTAAFDLTPVMLSQTICNPKQFERYLWPYVRACMDYTEKYDKLGFFFLEGENRRFYEFFNEAEKGRWAILSEQNDIFELKKLTPNLTVCGGMKNAVLGTATPEECVDYAKRLIDGLAFDGRYIFSEDKMVQFPSDCRRENLKAVAEFVTTYQI